MLGKAGCQDDADLVRGIAADDIATADHAAQTPDDGGDHLVTDLVAIGLVELREIVDGDHHHHDAA